MQKIYLLLRDNCESGPHSLDELLQLQLKPHDLIWVEGQSFGWAPPSSIEILQPYLASAQQRIQSDHSSYLPKEEIKTTNEPSRIFVSLPRGLDRTMAQAPSPIVEERKAEPETVLSASAPLFTMESAEPFQQPQPVKTLNTLKEEYGAWHFQKKKKKNHLHKGLAACLVIGLLAGGYLAAQYLFNPGKNQPAAVQQAKPLSTATIQDSIVREVQEPGRETGESSHIISVQEEKKPAPVKNMINKKNVPLPITENQRPTKSEEEKGEVPSTTSSAKEEPAPAVPEKGVTAEKKKGLGQKISGLFEKSRKDKEEVAVVEEGNTPRTTTTPGGERKAARRGEQAEAEKTTAPLTTFLDLRATDKKGDWMMGVVGIKLTLNNRSGAVVKTAAVEVSYYNEENALMEKKTIYFRNVPARFSQTAAVPDNRMADHASYKIISAVGKDDDAYVTNK